MLFNQKVNHLAGAIIALCLLIGCSYMWGKGKNKTRLERVVELLTLAEQATDFATKEAYIKQVVELAPNKWIHLSRLYMEQAKITGRLEDKLFYLQRVLEVVDKRSIDYHALGAYRELGRLHYENYEIDQALSYYKKMLEIESRYLKYRHDAFFKSLLTQYPEDCLSTSKLYLNFGDRAMALQYLRESEKYFYELQQQAYKDKELFSYLAEKFILLARYYEDFGLHEEKITSYEVALRFKLLDLDYRIDNLQLGSGIEEELENIIGHWEGGRGEFIAKGKLWAKFLLAKYYHASEQRDLAVGLVIQVLKSNFEHLNNVGNIMTIIRYISWNFVFRLEGTHTIHIMGHELTLLRLMLKKYYDISESFYKRFTLHDLHNWLLISLLAEDYIDVELILKKTLELKMGKKSKLYNIVLHNVGVVYFRKSEHNQAYTYLKNYYDFAQDLVATFNLAVLYLDMNDFNNAHRLLLKYQAQYPKTVFSSTVERYLEISEEYLSASSLNARSPIELEQGIVPIAK